MKPTDRRAPVYVLLAVSSLFVVTSTVVLFLRWAKPPSLPVGERRFVGESDYMLDDPRIPPLLRALRVGDAAKAHALMASGAKVNVADPYGFTPLMIAVADAKAAVPEILAAGADVNAKDKVEGQTALFIAARMGDLSIVKQLVRYGADVNATSIYGVTPLAEAAASCQASLVRFLVAKGANVNAQNQRGSTPLMSAAANDCGDVAEILIRAGAGVNARDDQGESVLSTAKRNRASHVARLLRQAGVRD